MLYHAGKRFSLLSFFTILMVCSLTALAQDKEWRQVSPAELQMKTPQVEPGADAEAIFWEIRIDDSASDELALRNYVRVKIFTERGRENYSKFDIPFTRGTKIKDISARVIKPDGTTVEIAKQDIFEREIVKANKVKVKAKSFAVPGIEPGVIVEYRYREVFEDAGAKGMSLTFQRDIPVEKLSYYYKPYNKKEPDYQSFNFSDTKFVKDDKGFYLAQRNNVPAFKEEPRMPPSDTVRPWMLLQGVSLNVVDVSAYSIAYTIKDPSNTNQYWSAVGTERSGVAKLMNKPDKDIKRAATEVTASAATTEEKLQKLYEFCQTQIRNTDFDPTLTDEQRASVPRNKSLADILKNKSGGGSSIDMLFGAMASSLGLETRLVLSGNRNKMFFKPDMTNESFLHTAAVAVKVGENFKFFDPGVKFLPYGMLVWYEEDVWSLLVGEKNYNWVQTPLSGVNKNIAKRTGKFKLLDDGTLEGTVKIEYSGQLALDAKLNDYDDSANQREENLRSDLKGRIGTAEISEVSMSEIKDSTSPVVYQYKVRVPNYAQKTGKRLFLQPGFFEYGENPLFATAARKYDVYFHYPWKEIDDIDIELPKGFALDNADAPDAIGDPQKISSLKIDIGVSKDSSLMKYHRDFYFGGGDKILFPVGAYQPLRNLFDAFHKADSHTITLKQN